MRTDGDRDRLLRTWERDRIVGEIKFRHVSALEQAKVARGRNCASLLVYPSSLLDQFDPQLRSVSDAASMMKQAKKAIVGRLDETRVGILLPGVEESGAKQFAASFRDKLPGHLNGTVRPELYVYGPCIYSGTGVDLLPPHDLTRSDSSQGGLAKDEPVFSSDGHEGLPPWKRAMDLAGAILALILFSPVMLLLAIVVKMTSRGPVFFTQERVGYQGRLFSCIKFRTMIHNTVIESHREHLKNLIRSDEPMTKLDVQDDPRLIPAGKLIRALALDELPQLINVIQGEMSLVGPRPAIPYEYREYETAHKLRFTAIPGITGLWQVSGKNLTTFSEMVALDISYAYAKSPWMDLKIILKTPATMLQQVRSAITKNGAQNERETEYGRSWVRVLGPEPDPKFQHPSRLQPQADLRP